MTVQWTIQTDRPTKPSIKFIPHFKQMDDTGGMDDIPFLLELQAKKEENIAAETQGER